MADVGMVELSFARQHIQCSSEEFIDITNNGEGLLTITSIELTPSGYDFDLNTMLLTNGDFPWYVGAGESVSISTTFSPLSVSEQNASIVIQSNDNILPEQRIELHGEGVMTD